MEQTANIQEKFCILASSYQADDRTRVLKHEETFAVFDRYGDVHPYYRGNPGLYHEDTRYLSRCELYVNDNHPVLLSSTIKDDNSLLTVNLTNCDMFKGSDLILPKDTFHILRSKVVFDGCCYEQLKIKNYSLNSFDVSMALHFDADFADLFEVRGLERKKKGDILDPVVSKNKVTLGYIGLDDLKRETILEFLTEPKELTNKKASYLINLKPHGEITLDFTITCSSGNAKHSALNFNKALEQAQKNINQYESKGTSVTSSNEQFNDWLGRSYADMNMMITDTKHGLYPYAGVPWFNTVFGRDGIITALEYLWINPDIAKGVLSYLSCNQGKELIPERDEEPGKILHETRKGEMANLKEIPFEKYYGSIDATPLFIVLAGNYYERTGDISFIRNIWSSIESALKWINQYGDIDGDGFVEYKGKTQEGLLNQGWKDSGDSIFHNNGVIPEPPIATCEVQGYVYYAKLLASKLAIKLGNLDLSKRLAKEASELQIKFENTFWCDEIKTYALALDGKKNKCKVRSSNAAQCLFTGIVNPGRADMLVKQLFDEDFFSGWGIRTIPIGEARYNPMSYHNGSIWPHDNALIANGLVNYGFKEYALRILTGLFDASIFLDLHRLPELFCGFARRAGEGPTLYPTACSPQSWSSASIFFILQSCIGLTIDAESKKIIFTRPALPESLQRIHIKNLSIQSSSIDIELIRHKVDVGINVIDRNDDIEVLVVK